MLASDSLSVTVEDRVCSFQNTQTAVAGDIDFSASGLAGKEVQFDNDSKHSFNVFCNHKFGYNVTAEASNLTSSTTTEEIKFTNDYDPKGTLSMWTGVVTGGNENAVLGGVDDAKVIKSSSNVSAEAGDDFSVAYKAYIGTLAPSATYSGTVKYTVSPAPAPALSNDTAMQNGDAPFYCGSTEEGTTVTLKDDRTGKSYFVTKMKDGNCWMTQNLWLPAGVTITTAKGNEYELPEDSLDYWEDTEYPVMTEGTHVDGQRDSSTNTGSYFNLMVAVTVDDASEVGPNAVMPDSVCPQGWVLPSDTTYIALMDAYDSVDDWKALWNYDRTGVGSYDNDNDDFDDYVTGWWTSSGARNGWGARMVAAYDVNGDVLGVSSLSGIGYGSQAYLGHNVRCMLVGVK